MNLERSTSPAMTLASMTFAFAAGFAASATQAQTPRECDGESTGPAPVAHVVDGRSLILADGREVRLAAIETVLPTSGDEDEARVAAALAAKAALETLVMGHEISLSLAGAGGDRYGRLTAYASVLLPSGEVSVQHELVAAGHAVVSPVPASPCHTGLRTAEREARAGGLGLWGAPYSVARSTAEPADILAEQGRFAVVQGKIASVRESAGVVYINFAQRWQDRFTATLLKRNESAFAGAAVAPQMLAGRTVEVRGWIEERNGPAVEVTRPEQIEIIQ